MSPHYKGEIATLAGSRKAPPKKKEQKEKAMKRKKVSKRTRKMK
jgi:hypothetical protein